jgi:hypothetical protein
MVKQKIHIVDHPILYNILHEIENNLSFNIFYYSNKNKILNEFESNKIDINKSLFLTKKNSSFLEKNLNVNKKQIFQISDGPYDIYNLIEKINIQLIKLRYDYQSKIFLKKYILDLNSREISKDSKKLKLTEKEIDTILFLHNKKTPQTIKVLLTDVWGYMSNIETHTVETHIYRLRKKILDIFNDDNFILSHDDGYLIE